MNSSAQAKALESLLALDTGRADRPDGFRMSAADHKLFRNYARVVEPGMTDRDILKAAGADFNVLTQPTGFKLPSGKSCTTPKSIVWTRDDREDETAYLGTFGNRRNVIQPRDFLSYFQRFVQQSGKRISLDVVGTLDNGKRFFMGSKLTEHNIEAILDNPENEHIGMRVNDFFKEEDLSDYWLVVTDYYSESRAPQVNLLCNRLVCTNGMSRTVKTKLAALTHRKGLSGDSVIEVLNHGIRQASAYCKIQDLLTEMELTPEQFNNGIRKFCRVKTGTLDNELPTKVKGFREIYHAKDKGMIVGIETYKTSTGEANAWRALNAVTQYITHKNLADQDAALRSSINGTRAKEPNAYLQFLADNHGTPDQQAELKELIAV